MKSYFITSLTPNLEVQIQKHTPDFILYRDKENANYANDAKKFLELCNNYPSIKCFLHQDPSLAKVLGAHGVHLTSTQSDMIADAKALGLEVILSTHTFEEVFRAEELGADYVTYSPIFASPNKGEPKGIEALRLLVQKTSVKVFALGGIISQEQIKEVQGAKAYGFASIRYFV
ncbi:MAG: thiamine phosphate synthase [Campylobacterales bacterium]|nr:thiamine phosphate synthase [Campylobacterales bacterium]